VDNRKILVDRMEIRFGEQKIVIEDQEADLIFDAMSLNLVDESIRVSSGVFKSLQLEVIRNEDRLL